MPFVPGATVLGPDASVIFALKNSDAIEIILYTSRMRIPDDTIIKSIKTLSDIINVKIDTEIQGASRKNQQRESKKYRRN